MDLNKVLKMNLDESESLLGEPELSKVRTEADERIEASMELLRSLGKSAQIDELSSQIKSQNGHRKIANRYVLEGWDDIVKEAEEYCPEPVILEDFMSEREINQAFQELDEIKQDFSRKTSIVNKTDLSFLMIATALQVVKSLLFPYVSQKFQYGDKFDSSNRLIHNDPSIEKAYRKANDGFRDKHLKQHGTGRWINILYQTPPYDITKGSKDLGINMGGKYHRMYTLGHDPILGWIFGTANILTDVITLNNFQSYRVIRTPNMRITGEMVPISVMLGEGFQYIKDDFLNLPAAIFAQAQHLKSDKYTKVGLPVPIIPSLNENFASELYKSHYDALCFSRDVKIVGASFAVSKIIDMIISLVHGLFRKENEAKDFYEVRTRKILLISNSIASTSTVIAAGITKNPKNLDIGGLLNTVTRLFTDIRFIARIKQEFIESEISKKVQKEIEETDRLFAEI
jgi:hypothetical protein